MSEELKQYTGTKTVLARPMTRGTYNEYRGWTLPADENGNDEGYLVEYTDGSKSNDERHEGYISWSPKEVFDKAYAPSDTFADRLLIETRTIAENMNKLNAFMAASLFPTLPRETKDLLYEQQRTMSTLVQILGKRLEQTGSTFTHKN